MTEGLNRKLEGVGRLAAAVTRMLEDLSPAERASWRAELARTLAETMDDAPNASTARELRATMAELTAERVPQEMDPVDDLASRRAARIAEASGQ